MLLISVFIKGYCNECVVTTKQYNGFKQMCSLPFCFLPSRILSFPPKEARDVW